jgi:hypothetical protein
MRRIPVTVGLICLAVGIATITAAEPTQQSVPSARAPRDPTSATKGTGVLKGRVTAADTGRPLRRARVTVSAPSLSDGGRRTTSTDGDGRFEVTGLPAARYRISVNRSGYLPLEFGQRRPGEQGRPLQLDEGETLEHVDFALPRMGVIAGRVMDEAGEPMEGVSVYALRSMFFDGQRRLVPVISSNIVTDDAGEFRIARVPPGSYFVVASTKETWMGVEAGKPRLFGYLPTYFPSLANAASARAVKVSVGQEVPGIDIGLIPGRAATVSGSALDSQGRPFYQVNLNEEVRGVNFASFRGGPSAMVQPDGSFVIRDVAPGDYAVSATRRPGADPSEAEVATATVTIDGGDIEGLTLTGSRGASVRGKVIVEGSDPPKLSQVRVTVAEPLRNQVSPALLGTFRDSNSGVVNDDGTFSVTHVWTHARFQVTVPDGWMVKSILHEGRDVADTFLELRSGEELTGVELTITDRVTRLGGTLLDGRQEPTRGSTVVVFPSAREGWSEGSRSVKTTRPDQQGRWEIKALPPGDYLAIALDFIEDGAWNDPDVLESLRKDAKAVTLPEAGDVAVPLTLAKLVGK